MKASRLIALLTVFLSVTSAWGRSEEALSILQIVDSNLKFIAHEQKQNQDDVYWAGEWPTRIQSTLVPAAVGVGKLFGHNQEASAFTTASVINALASLYLDHPELQPLASYQEIPNLISKGVETFPRYQEGELFNFYPPKIVKGVRVHQPADMSLIPAWKGFTNIPEDADTSSAVYTALLYHSRIQNSTFEVPQKALESLENFRDLNRKAHYYNRGEKRKNTGTYMTWQFDEENPEMPRFWFAAPEKGTRIPFNRNDVDCIVNLNVLRMLALNKSASTEGRERACAMINDMIAKKEHATCGIYYPNTYNLAYSVAQARKAGETCFEEPRLKDSVEFILAGQSGDGGWNNDQNIWEDRIQATAFAMNSLLEMGDLRDSRIYSSLKYGVDFLMRNMSRSKQGHLYWKGETFFTATAIARSLIIWKSHSYTTAVAASALLKFQKAYP